MKYQVHTLANSRSTNLMRVPKVLSTSNSPSRSNTIKNINSYIQLISFDELLLIEEKIFMLVSSIKNTKPYVINQCIEWWNCFVVSCLFSSSYEYIKDTEVKVLVRSSCSLLMYSIILSYYSVLLKNANRNSYSDQVLDMILYHHRVFLLICEYLILNLTNSLICSQEEMSIISKLSKQIALYIKHNTENKTQLNTMIINDSDQMGLSQLYQLRGRVGRSNRTAYAFLMYKRNKMLKEVAEKRLEAIKEFTDLGSGFKIAMRDLEIRGAGSLLGRSQHGHMQAVGYDLYCKMLNEAVKNLKGIPTIEDFNTTIDLDADAYIPPSYIVNEIQKLDIYKRIAGIEDEKECDDMREELLDRFGEIPKSAENLLRIALIRSHAHRLYMPEVKGKNEVIQFQLRTDAPIVVENIPLLLLMVYLRFQIIHLA